ncbi:HD-GYP domain-containing protein [Thermotalea metallivorans]|uniref:Cyclic di-GMP phosphodiesterase response regulator RpfG n=1 Tax=Thermotalea metallivorans TaxID=520762 RepID=A0A140L0V7_9FIRM|nr:HD-GYP domain-containing protein [Thermotalea metallivorans]KXG74182.1 Cyclic di-GMP phosphodiesterase response regulator RpfG [Thermotalea metallivorans]
MRLVRLENVTSGMILAKDIYSCEGKILLAKGVTLTSHFIKRLQSLSIGEIYIEDEISRDIEIVDIIDDKTRMMAKQTLYQAVQDLKANKSLDFSSIQMVINRIVDELLRNKDIMVNLSDLRCVDEYTFAHSVNVAVLSIVIGKALGFHELRLRDLGIGAILHDIGKTQVPNEILNKPGKLELHEIEIMKNHPAFGYEILKEYCEISSLSRVAALMHHERVDGSGYPFGKRGSEIPEFARIIAIADTYDAMTSNRVYRKKITPNKAVEYLMSMGDYHFDHDMVKVFLNHITVFPVGTIVKLNTQEKAIVIDNNRYCPTRPIVRIIKDSKGEYVTKFQEIDLQKKLNIFIEEVCDE